MTRTAVALGAGVSGATLAVLTVALHDRWWGWLLGVATSAAAALALPPGWWTRLPLTLGWSAMAGWLAAPHDGGDYLVSADLPGYLLLAVAVALPVAGLVTAVAPPEQPRLPGDPPSRS
ncbi:MAG: hypothetical protein R2731_19135 [Nocardioides sp.]